MLFYIFQSHKNIEGPKENERERERDEEWENQCQEEYEIGFDFRCICYKTLNNIVKAWYSALVTFEVFKRYV